MIRRKHGDLRDCGKSKTMIKITERDFDKEVLECKLPELVFSGELLKQVTEIAKPYLKGEPKPNRKKR